MREPDVPIALSVPLIVNNRVVPLNFTITPGSIVYVLKIDSRH